MGNHSASTSKGTWTHCAGYLINAGDQFTVLRTRQLTQSWPVIAKKLDDQGRLENLRFSEGQVTLATRLSSHTLENLLKGHAKPKATKKALAIALMVAALGVFASIPLGQSQVTLKPKPIVKASDPCRISMLQDWLLGTKSIEEPRLGKTSVLGGVTVGTIECNGSRYSYTLGSKEPKRVLNLKKLNS